MKNSQKRKKQVKLLKERLKKKIEREHYVKYHDIF